ncbi:hypothetical protein CPAST_c37090 [Clostridium pasteurianum DSM 525 = ATCC 6013]|uniref:Uncharacterized protein n=1 Tax=Clostridium pasteurianum DSM 525 = ATCC 6013 TaxID=1262449 RepID=A0A0H3JAR0_CLOPA|nr:hypothetical protein [Clostridium pasteurianum]AJA49763.1 hypothetical protein CPAST_c37090 [Clostridium pasteurianum DSM 525 = ATCC 6013]AJA53751.1 hypothetical protein CLPA_c37090 [Clostridium pasteurianum DSM 525 = ATCC 6013]AOZ76913.1 hypothetical protein AQ983_18040 [Clostridium pasteurianum DSM 525 = ATCC 6013]AOZ80710.1 hypothetical protein AQ984_18035 [Clostridium pasteurianum]ELP57546.1 hypothetical protein F502_18723 [Clostridium pasteurianum DSM 525 = ATCC 6013]
MSEYKLEVKGFITLNDYGNIYDYIGIVGMNDKFTITIDYLDEKNMDLIKSMLKYKDFIVTDSGKSEDGNYYIQAQRNDNEYKNNI